MNWGDLMELKIKDIAFTNNKNKTMRNEITFNTKMIDTFAFEENHMVELVSSMGSITCFVSYANYNTEKIAYLSFALNSINDGDKFILKEIPHVDVERYHIAKIQDLKTDKVLISDNIMQNIMGDKKLKGVSIVNKLNGYSLNLPMNKVDKDMNNQGRVTLSIKHRKLLDVELPTFINQIYLDRLEGSLSEYYNSETDNVKYTNYYEASEKVKKSLKDYKINLLSVYPIYHVETRTNPIKWLYKGIIGMKNKILSFFIGQRSISLRVIRPYPIDESENLVRLSKTAMELLGLDETDTVIIRNEDCSCKARVLLIDDWDIISNENRIKSEQELSLLIGIPAYMRSKLELPFINSNVFVERDLSYFFRKHLNSQVMTIISFMLSFPVLGNIPNPVVRYISIAMFTIFMIYLSFSEVREKISNK